MSEELWDFALVGAGVSGLYLGSELSKRGFRVKIFEKSRGLGGRLATRRGASCTFDHGAQFFSLPEELDSLQQQLLDGGVAKLWFSDQGKDRFFSPQGATQLAKHLAIGLNIHREAKVDGIRREGHNLWRIKGEGFPTTSAHQIIITAPLPQAHLLLEKSEIKSFALPKVEYEPALVLLWETECPLPLPESGYLLSAPYPLDYVVDMKRKGISAGPSHVVVFSGSWSCTHFEETEGEIFVEAKKILSPLGWPADFKGCTLKKWRYAQPVGTVGMSHLSPTEEPGLHFAGDGFGGGSVAGALRSARSLLLALIEAERTK